MKNMIGYCGLDCEKCDAYLATIHNDQALREKTAKLWAELNNAPILPEHINCEGCRMNGAKTVFCESLCGVRQCALKKGVSTCGDCPELETCSTVGTIISNNPVVLKNGVTLEKIALIPLVFYLTQLIVDLAATKFADKIGYRTCVVASQVLSAVGLLSMTVLPELFSVSFTGILISVVLYAIGSGLIEVLVSPIVEACPFENKDGVMSLLHSFYCWGAMAVILGSTLFFALFGTEKWKILVFVWALVPLYNTLNFISCPIERLVEDGKSMGVRNLLKTPIFWLMILLMVCSGASEASMAQWASAFTESAIGVSKTVGDLAGPCLFAMFMGISRMLYSKFSHKFDLTKVMLVCGSLCIGCYLLASLSPLPILGLAGCALCGLGVGIMWPGSISISAQKCPRGGTAMFAFLALAGDLGAMVSPAMVGRLSEASGSNLKTGLFAATIFPIILVFALLMLRKQAGNAAKRKP